MTETVAVEKAAADAGEDEEEEDDEDVSKYKLDSDEEVWSEIVYLTVAHFFISIIFTHSLCYYIILLAPIVPLFTTQQNW